MTQWIFLGVLALLLVGMYIACKGKTKREDIDGDNNSKRFEDL